VTLGQLILDLPHRAAHGAEDFLVSGCNDRRFARTPSALVAADAENSRAEAFARLTPAALVWSCHCRLMSAATHPTCRQARLARMDCWTAITSHEGTKSQA
jgi:hypothetical protein